MITITKEGCGESWWFVYDEMKRKETVSEDIFVLFLCCWENSKICSNILELLNKTTGNMVHNVIPIIYIYIYKWFLFEVSIAIWHFLLGNIFVVYNKFYNLELSMIFKSAVTFFWCIVYGPKRSGGFYSWKYLRQESHCCYQKLIGLRK